VSQEDGWAPLSTVGNQQIKNDPSFDPRNFGLRKLSELVKAQTYLVVKEVPIAAGTQLTGDR
jgi:hypothetical protein